MPPTGLRAAHAKRNIVKAELAADDEIAVSTFQRVIQRDRVRVLRRSAIKSRSLLRLQNRSDRYDMRRNVRFSRSNRTRVG
jgi:hypothetical protein